MITGAYVSLAVLAAVFLFFAIYFRGGWIPRIRIPRQLPTQGLLFPVTSVASMLSHNSLFPRIKLFNEYFEYRIILKKKIYYKDIAKIDAGSRTFFLKSVIVSLNNGGRLWLTPGKEDNFNELSKFLSEKVATLSKPNQK